VGSEMCIRDSNTERPAILYPPVVPLQDRDTEGGTGQRQR
jgi:hypothetical protein